MSESHIDVNGWDLIDWSLNKMVGICRCHFQVPFPEWKSLSFDLRFIDVCSLESIDIKSALVLVKALHQTANKPLPELMLIHFTDVYVPATPMR